jgi:hypothetical protein
LPYRPGTWFTFPLERGGCAVGIVARKRPRGRILLTYMFGPRRATPPELSAVENLTLEDALTVMRVGDLRLLDGSWTILGHSPTWRPERWPMPVFMRRCAFDERVGSRIVYDADNPAVEVSEERVPYTDDGSPRDGLYGTLAAERWVDSLLDASRR